MASSRVFGVDLHSQDGKVLPPTIVELERDALYKWFLSNSNTETVPVRILCVQIGSSEAPLDFLNGFEVPLPDNVIEHAVWKPDVYFNLAKNASGGAAGLVEEPPRIILQTPIDIGPFCSLAMSRHRNTVKAIYLYDHDIFEPAQLKGSEKGRSAWRSSGLQVITLAEMFLQAHSVWVSQSLAKLIANVTSLEVALTESHESPCDFTSLSRALHLCHSNMVDLERRCRFEVAVIEGIEVIVGSSVHGKLPWASVAPQKATIASRKFDFESLPRRIENCRATLNSLMQRRNEQLNLQLTQASHRIAEAALQDSKSMKTIAILTMVLLPGTAVSSLFSMDMFNWSSRDGSRIASKWLWIYFVVSVPLTGMILIAWWRWTRKATPNTVLQHDMVSQNLELSLHDVEHAPGRLQGKENFKIHSLHKVEK